MGRTTIIWSPHPDDETLYTGAYVATAAARGDRLILVAVTDGGASGAKPSNWTQADMMRVRVQEQTRAWDLLTFGKGEIIRMGLPDGSVYQASVQILAKELETAYSTNGDVVEHYAACNNGNFATTDVRYQAPDHRAVAAGVKAAAVRVLRMTKSPNDTTTGGTVYLPGDAVTSGGAAYGTQALAACQAAKDSYAYFGQKSVASMFNSLQSSGFRSRVITGF